METKLTPEALKAWTEEVIREASGTSDRRRANLLSLYCRLAAEVTRLRDLWNQAHRQAEEALARIEAGVLPGGFYSLLQPGVEIDRVETRIEALRDAIGLIEAEGGGATKTDPRLTVTRADGRVVDVSVPEN